MLAGTWEGSSHPLSLSVALDSIFWHLCNQADVCSFSGFVRRGGRRPIITGEIGINIFFGRRSCEEHLKHTELRKSLCKSC